VVDVTLVAPTVVGTVEQEATLAGRTAPSAPVSVASEVQDEGDSARSQVVADREAVEQWVVRMLADQAGLAEGRAAVADSRAERRAGVEAARSAAAADRDRRKASVQSELEATREEGTFPWPLPRQLRHNGLSPNFSL